MNNSTTAQTSKSMRIPREPLAPVSGNRTANSVSKPGKIALPKTPVSGGSNRTVYTHVNLTNIPPAEQANSFPSYPRDFGMQPQDNLGALPGRIIPAVKP